MRTKVRPYVQTTPPEHVSFRDCINEQDYCPEMVLVLPGIFDMGSPTEEGETRMKDLNTPSGCTTLCSLQVRVDISRMGHV